MVSKIAEHITQKLVASAFIEESDKDLYTYGFFLLISHLFFFIITIIAGFLMRIPTESIVFYIVFLFLRTYAGGVHAKTETTCILLTTFALTVSVICIRILSQIQRRSCAILLLIGSCLCILLFSPLDTIEKPLTSIEKIKYRSICYRIVLLCVAGAVFTYILQLDTFFYSIVIGVFLENILLLVGITFYKLKFT